MCCGMYIPVESGDACSIFEAGLRDLVERMDSWCMMLEEVRETILRQKIHLELGQQFFTFGEKCMSLIMRFLLHRSS